MTISKAGVKDPAEPDDTRSDMDIVQAVGKSMQRITRPRNALDVLGVPKAIMMPELRVVGGANPAEDSGLQGEQVKTAGQKEPVPDNQPHLADNKPSAPYDGFLSRVCNSCHHQGIIITKAKQVTFIIKK